MDTRRKRRQRKVRDEKRREKRIAEEENKKIMGKYPSPNIHIESHQHFPEFTPENHQRTESESSERSLSPTFTSTARTSDDAQSCAGSLSSDRGLSFAKVKLFCFSFILTCLFFNWIC